MARYLHLILLMSLLVSLNACMVANYQVTTHDSSQGRIALPVSHDQTLSVVIPRYYRVELRCRSGSGGGGWLALIDLLPKKCDHEERDFIGMQIHDGVLLAISEAPLGRPVEFNEHIRSQGLVWVVAFNKQINNDPPYSEWLSLATLFMVPAYTTHNYVLSYSVLSDFKLIREGEYHVTERAISGVVSWLLAPVMYGVWGNINLGEAFNYGPRASVVRETTEMFLYEARRDGVL